MRPLIERAQVDIGILRRLGFVQSGQMLGDQLGWSEAWIPEPDRRLFFIIDLRGRKRPCAVFVVRDPERQVHQLFALKRMKGRFGRQEYRLICRMSVVIPMSVRAMKAGAVDFLPKPFRDQDMIDAVALLSLERDFCRRRLARQKMRLKAVSPRRDRKSETTTREKWPQKRPFRERAVSCGFRKTGWWPMQPSETGLGPPLPCYSLLFEVFQGAGIPVFCCRQLHASGFSLQFVSGI